MLKAKAKAKDSKFVLEDNSRARTKAKDNNTELQASHHAQDREKWRNLIAGPYGS